MKLLFKKQGNRGRKNATNGITINRTSIYINGTAFERLVKKGRPIYGNIGINQEGNLSLYISYEVNELLYSFYLPKKTTNQARMSMNTKEQSNVIEPYIGVYEIKFVSMEQKNGITEVVLQKL